MLPNNNQSSGQPANLDGLIQASKNITIAIGALNQTLATLSGLTGPFLPTAGGTMTGDLNMGDHSLLDVATVVIDGGTASQFLKADGSLDSSVYEKSLFSQIATVTVANTVTETTLLGAGSGSVIIPAGFFTAGRTIKIKGFGYYSATSTPNITIKIKFGSTTILTTGAAASGNDTNGTCRTIGATGTVQSQGLFQEVGAAAIGFPMVNTSTNTIDTTITQTVGITVTWGAASAGNTISLSNLIIEVIN